MNLRSLIDRRIREAQEQGKFRNLSGEGAPQDLEDNPFEDPEMRLAYKVMSNAGYCPPWMQLIKDLDADLDAAELVWEDYRSHRRRQMDGVHRSTVAYFAEMVAEIDATRGRALDRLEKRWTEINRKISYLNATVPSEGLMKVPLSVDRKRRRFEMEFPLLGGMISRR